MYKSNEVYMTENKDNLARWHRGRAVFRRGCRVSGIYYFDTQGNICESLGRGPWAFLAEKSMGWKKSGSSQSVGDMLYRLLKEHAAASHYSIFIPLEPQPVKNAM